MLLLVFVLSALEVLGLRSVSETLDRLTAYLPHVIGAGFIVAIGLVLARITGNIVGSGAAAARLASPRQLGTVARGIVIFLAGLLAAEQLGVDTEIVVNILTALVAAVAVGLALAFALGSKDVVQAILAGHYLRQTLPVGHRIEAEGRSGLLERVGTTETLFRDGHRSWSVPNARLLQAVVVRSTEEA
jgi:hypothetical protein